MAREARTPGGCKRSGLRCHQWIPGCAAHAQLACRPAADSPAAEFMGKIGFLQARAIKPGSPPARPAARPAPQGPVAASASAWRTLPPARHQRKQPGSGCPAVSAGVWPGLTQEGPAWSPRGRPRELRDALGRSFLRSTPATRLKRLAPMPHLISTHLFCSFSIRTIHPLLR